MNSKRKFSFMNFNQLNMQSSDYVDFGKESKIIIKNLTIPNLIQSQSR